MIKFDVLNRWSGGVQFTAEIDCDESLPLRFKLGLAVKWSYKNDANLSDANLSGADLRDAVLRDAVLRSFKADMWMTLTENPSEVPALIKSLREGKVDGSQYEGECACLVGTIANVKGVDYQTLTHSSNNPAERWFMMIREGDKPGDDSGGGFAAKMALEWAEEFCRLHDIKIESASPIADHGRGIVG